MIVYLDTSTVLRVLLRQKGKLRGWEKWSKAYSSELLRVEARRVIDRLRLDALLDDEGVARAHEELAKIEELLGFVELDRRILERASDAMPTAVKTLDALHLASALSLTSRKDEPVLFATHDRQQKTAARALGFQCIG